MQIFQLENGYHYNSDTMALYDFISSFLSVKFNKSVLEVGSGSGVLGLLLKRDFTDISLTLLDIQEQNIRLCEKNLKTNGLEAKLILSDFKEYKSGERYGLIISNPPFYHNGVKQSTNAHIAVSRYAKFLSLQDFVKVSNTHLAPNGELMFCYDSASLSDIMLVLKEHKLTVSNMKFIHSKPDKNAGLVLIRAKKNSRSKCEITPPLFMKDGLNDSAEAKKIYERASLESIICSI